MASQEVLTALETLHREIERLEPAIKHVETAQQVTQMVKGIPQMHLNLVEELLKTDSQFKNGLQKICEKELTDLTSEHKKLQKTTTEIQQQVKLEQEALAKLRETVQSFHERVEKINFPERLDKLDANVAGIMAAIQSVQSRLDGLERSIKDYIQAKSSELYSKVDAVDNSLSQKLEGSAKNTNTQFEQLFQENRNLKILLLISIGLSAAIAAIFFTQ